MADPTVEAMIRAAGQPQAQPMQIVAPMNDVQLVGWIAAQVMGGDRGVKPAEAVEAAIDALAEAFVQFNAGAFQRAVERAKHRLQLAGGGIRQ
jgi:hypothetical protein